MNIIMNIAIVQLSLNCKDTKLPHIKYATVYSI